MQTKLKSVLVLLVIVLLQFGQTEAAYTCTATTCDCSGISRVPQDLNIANTNITALTLRDSVMRSPLGSFPSLPQLQQLSLISNEMTSIQPSAFANLPNVQNITLSSNNMTSVQPRAFSDLAQLQTISLSYNRISSGIQPAAFSDLPQLQDLVLDNNRITAVQPGTFANLPMLQELDLSSNQIDRVQPNVFKNLTGLRELDLSENRITASSLLASDVCSDLSGITTVELSDNEFQCNCDSLPTGATCSLDIIKQVRCTGAGDLTYPLTLKDGSLMCTSAAADLRGSLYHLPLILLAALLLKHLL
ncbi:leucine-rich repeat-containing protein 15-like [Branchiostoma lanceolatum]|uniref:leucine-rich repeat-containing protein 15-like n=1 Tax=Branchiostoma lanceolatum TaxID=7740 RepID=UPI003454D441